MKETIIREISKQVAFQSNRDVNFISQRILIESK